MSDAGTWHYRLTRLVLRVAVRSYLRLGRPEGLDRLPAAPFVLCFNHLNWADPFVLVAIWPPRPRLYIYGPKEVDMGRGWRNRLISWTGIAVPFKPSKTDLVASTRRAVAVLEAGHVLGIAAEGRLSEDEDIVMPLHEGAAFIAIRACVPLVPLALNGTRWLRFGKRVRVRIGEPIPTVGLEADRETLARVTGQVHAALSDLVQGYPDVGIPGPVGRWLTDIFNERPWRARQP